MLLMLVTNSLFAKESATHPIEIQERPKNELPYLLIADKMPTFEGGDLNHFRDWVVSQIIYPEDAIRRGIEGLVVVSFIVDTVGNLKDIEIATAPDPLLGDEVMRVVKSSLPWSPAEDEGKKVCIKLTIPIRFKIPQQAPTESVTTPASTPQIDEKVDKNGEKREVMPSFLGGDLNIFHRWVTLNIQYPRGVQKTEGRVVVTFTVGTKGKVSNIEIIESTHTLFSQEVIRVIQSAPDWSPAWQDGKPVRMKFTMPIIFRANDRNKVNYNIPEQPRRTSYRKESGRIARKPSFEPYNN